MYNNNVPNQAKLPSGGRLLRSTLVASAAAMAILFTTILPAEYAIDPTGIGRMLGLTQMGEIKAQLAEEAKNDASNLTNAAAQTEALIDIQKRLMAIEAKMDGTSAPQKVAEVVEPVAAEPVLPEAEPVLPEQVAAVVEAEPVAEVEQPAETVEEPLAKLKKNTMELTLDPSQGAEIKLEMKEGAVASFRWSVEGGVVNFDTHGDPYEKPQDFYHGYGKGKDSVGEVGNLKAAFGGQHGWFWRNRGDAPVVLRLETQGEYLDIKRVL